MGKINKVNKQTTNPYLNLYDLDVVNKVGREGHYYVASRAKTEDDLKLSHIENNDPDGVAIYSLYGEKKDRVVLIRQFRYPLGGYVYELPARTGGSGRELSHRSDPGTERRDRTEAGADRGG